MTKRSIALALSLVALSAFGTINPAAAQTVAEFYKKTNISLLVGSGAGGGYDAYSRLLARHMGNFIPGNPTIVVQNMPGAGGLKSANHLYNIAPKDGSVMAILHNTLTLNQIAKSQSANYDMRKFGWLGSMSVTSTICALTQRAGINESKDLLTKEVIIGTSAGSTAMIPAVLNSLAGTKFKNVRGYESTSNVLLAMERGEVHGVCGWGWDSAKVQASTYLERKAFFIGLDIANEPNPDLKAMGVPFVMDMVADGPNKQALQLILSTQFYNRPFATAPGVPADRLQALRTAFAETLKDKTFLADAEKANMDIEYLTPERVAAALNEAFDTPDAVQKTALDELVKAGWGGL